MTLGSVKDVGCECFAATLFFLTENILADMSVIL